MIINVALTGAVPTTQDNPRLPMTPEQIARDVLACADAGACVFHLHMRDATGRPVHSRDLYERTIGLIRSSRPDLLLGVTTSSRVGSDLSERMIGLNVSADCKPDFASLTIGSFNFPNSVSHNPPDQIRALLDRMLEFGIKPEFEIFELGMINTLWSLIDHGGIPLPSSVNLLLGSFGSAPAFIGDLAQMVDRLPAESEWAAAGIGVFQRPMTIAAAVMGGNVRTGLEDNPRGSGTMPWSNVEAVRLAVNAAELAGRPIASPLEARRRFGFDA